MTLISLIIKTDTGFQIEIAWVIPLLLLIILIAWVVYRRTSLSENTSYLELSEAEFGPSFGKLRLKANTEDLQIGFKFWTELTTRKIGLAFDEEHDVIDEVYNSWYEFFGISRELIKSIPVTKVRKNETTKQIVLISIHILNKELRPHLTRWQARYRHWWEDALNNVANKDVPPQDLQRNYPHYKELIKELKAVNNKLVIYAEHLKRMIEI